MAFRFVSSARLRPVMVQKLGLHPELTHSRTPKQVTIAIHNGMPITETPPRWDFTSPSSDNSACPIPKVQNPDTIIGEQAILGDLR